MATLAEGHKYDLSSQENLLENKSLVFVKLTESALRTIEEHVRSKSRLKDNSSATVQFYGNTGRLYIPTTNGATQYTFDVCDNLEMGQQGSFECIRQNNSEGTLRSLGPMLQKLKIHAKDDVYERTKQRMTVAKEENEKNFTQVIKSNSSDIGKKVRVLGKRSDSPALPAFSGKQSPKKPHRSATSDIARKPLRDRIIHLLALRGYKKPELLARLYKDGVKEKDKKNISSLLSQVAFMKDNTYTLHRHVWNDICDDWPFYSEQDRQLLKRRKPENLTPPTSDSSASSAMSPYNSQPNTSPNYKRPSSDNSAGTDPNPKKQRVSHYRKPTTSPDISLSSGTVGYYNSTKHKDEGSYTDQSILHHNDNRAPPLTPESSPEHEPTPVTRTLKELVQRPAYLCNYTKICSVEQRSRYKEDFNRQYTEYQDLHNRIGKISHRFSHLETKLQQAPSGSTEWQRVKQQIITEYNQNKQSSSFKSMRVRFQYLHDKLAHIKMLVLDYDRQC